MSSIQVISLVLSVSSFLVPLIAGFRNRRTILWLYILMSLVFDITIVIVKRVFHLNVYPLANTYVFVEFVMLSLYYYRSISDEYKYFLHTIIGIGLLYIAHTLFYGLGHRNGTGAACLSVIYLLYALAGFYSISKKHVHNNILASAFFWVNVAMLTGSAGRMILFLFEDYLVANNNPLLGKLWMVYQLFNVLVNILFAVALSRKHE